MNAKTLNVIPWGYDEIVKVYGNPVREVNGKLETDPVWYTENLRTFYLPFTFYTSWSGEPVTKVLCHKLVGEAFVDALYEIKETAGESFLKKYKLNSYGGCFNPRLKTNSKEISTHWFGIAFDMCPELGPFGELSRLPWWYTEAFLKRGFINLWQYDGMHFQACGGY